MNLSCNITIGNLSFNFHCPSSSWHQFLKKHYGPFFHEFTKARAVNITVKPGISGLNLPKKLQIIENKSNLAILRYDFSSASTAGFGKTVLSAEKDRFAFDSWFRIFFTVYGIQRNTVIIHGAGFVNNNRSYIFPGRSGRGKSTLIRILGKDKALTDELVCVYLKNRAYYAASTPYWGELKKGTGKTYISPLKAVLCPGHGNRVFATRLPNNETLKQLLRTVLFFSKDTPRMNKLLTFLHALSLKIPAGTLWFKKNSSKTQILSILNTLVMSKTR
jgi:hypothetical protein